MTSFMQDIERDLKEHLDHLLEDYAAGESTDSRQKEIVRWVKERVLESYRNGQRDCPKCNPKPAKPPSERPRTASRSR